MAEKIYVDSFTSIDPNSVLHIPFKDKVNADNIPEEMKTLKRWCVWKPEWDDPEALRRKVKKVPYDRTGHLCHWEDLRNLMTFEKALEKLENHPEYGGLQFALFAMDEIFCLDYDAKLSPEWELIGSCLFMSESREHGRRAYYLAEREQTDLENLGMPYAEVSPSSNGLRVIAYGTTLRGQYHGEMAPEIYSDNKLITITGHHVQGTSKNLIPARDIEAFIHKYYPPSEYTPNYDKLLEKALPMVNDDVLLHVRTSKTEGEDFKKAYDKGEDVKGDKSATDYFVIAKMAWYTPYIAQLYELFRASALKRDKWEEKYYPSDNFWKKKIEEAGVPCDYVTRTIIGVLSRQNDVWDPNFTTNTDSEEAFYKDKHFKVTEDGIFTLQNVGDKENPEFKYVMISPTPAYIEKVGYNKKSNLLYAQLVYKTKETWRKMWLQPDQLTLKLNLAKFGNIILMNDDDVKLFTQLFKKQIAAAMKNPYEEVYSAIGYYDDDTCFVLGNRKISADKIEEITPLEMLFASKFVKKGTLEGYVEAGKVLMQFDVLRAKFYCTMSSLILPLVYKKNVTVTHSVVSGNLKGQSSFWNMGAFGHPRTLQVNPSSTEKGIQELMTQAQGLPTSIEELTGKSKLIKDLQYKSTTGTSRTLLNRNSQIKGGEEQISIIIANSEYPLFNEKDRLGNFVRNLTLDDLIPLLPNDTIFVMENSIESNYGHAGEILIQLILQEKDSLFNLLQEFERKLPDMGNSIPKNRFKNMVAFFCLSGYFCEKLFAKIGIENKNPVQIMEHILNKNLGSLASLPLYERAMPIIGEFFISHKSDFTSVLPGDREPSNRKGFIEKDSVAFLPDALEKFLDVEFGEGQGKVIIKDLLKNDCLIPKDAEHPKQRHQENGIKIPVYKIKKEAFKKFANLVLENTDDTEEEEKKDLPSVSVPKQRIPQGPEVTQDIDAQAFFQEA